MTLSTAVDAPRHYRRSDSESSRRKQGRHDRHVQLALPAGRSPESRGLMPHNLSAMLTSAEAPCQVEVCLERCPSSIDFIGPHGKEVLVGAGAFRFARVLEKLRFWSLPAVGAKDSQPGTWALSHQALRHPADAEPHTLTTSSCQSTSSSPSFLSATLFAERGGPVRPREAEVPQEEVAPARRQCHGCCFQLWRRQHMGIEVLLGILALFSLMQVRVSDEQRPGRRRGRPSPACRLLLVQSSLRQQTAPHLAAQHGNKQTAYKQMRLRIEQVHALLAVSQIPGPGKAVAGSPDGLSLAFFPRLVRCTRRRSPHCQRVQGNSSR